MTNRKTILIAAAVLVLLTLLMVLSMPGR